MVVWSCLKTLNPQGRKRPLGHKYVGLDVRQSNTVAAVHDEQHQAMSWLRVSLFSQALLAGYFQVIQCLPLGRWNYQPGFTPFGVETIHGRATAPDVLLMAVFIVPFVAFWFAYSKGLRWLMWICTLGYTVWLTLQIKTWWVPYAFGASDSWARVYQRVFSQSTQLLPSAGRHLAPDGMHLVLQLLLTAVVVPAVIGLLKPSGNPA